jgi:hypothetical protein
MGFPLRGGVQEQGTPIVIPLATVLRIAVAFGRGGFQYPEKFRK